MDDMSLDILLRGGHINLAERRALGIWPHPPLFMSDLIEHVCKKLKIEKCYPKPWVEKKDGELVDDAVSIEYQEPDKYIYRSRCAHPAHLYKIIDKSELFFSTARDAVCHYLKQELHLPGDLDGWKVVDNNI